ncbi:MAG: hypothetical protein OEW48_02330, partial [Phycisphaerae bacterium]|nr:hypothetical protein [Phycisphaerae bacterium]
MPRCPHGLVDQTVGLFIADDFFFDRVVMNLSSGADGDIGQVHQGYAPSRRCCVAAGLFTRSNRFGKSYQRFGVG